MKKKNWTPDSMYKALKKSIIGQDNYLKDLCSCIWMQNQRRQHYIETGEKLTQPKFNMLVIGKSGMGKTSSIKEVAKLLDMPVIIEDASEFRGAGWKGRQVSEIVGDIVKTIESDYEKDKASAGFSIVVLDEIDKIFMEMNQNTDSFSPASNLLKFIEGTNATFMEGNQKTSMNTENLLFICIGAFDGLEEIIENRIHPKTIGFSTGTQAVSDANILANVSTEDLKAYGMSEQLLGRLPFISVMNELNASDYKKILLKSDISPVKHLNKLCINRQGVKITITDTAAKKLAETVVEKNLGARGLQQELIALFKDTIYQMPDSSGIHEYRLEYDNGFKIGSYSGERNRTLLYKKYGDYELTKFDVEKLQQELDIRNQDRNCIALYTDAIFETIENYMQTMQHKSISEDMDYYDIINAKYLLCACITKLFIDEECAGIKKTRIHLLSNIKTFDIHKENTYSHHLSMDYELCVKRLYYLSDRKIDELKLKTWTIAKLYALQLYELEYADEEDLLLE